MPRDLAEDTKVAPIPGRSGHYSTNLPDAWSWYLPAGGVLMTVALRAMQQELADPGFFPVSATTIFCASIPAGPLETRVHVLRRGNAFAQARATLRSLSSEGPDLEVSATFSRERPGPGIDMLDARPPNVPLPAEALDIEEPRRSADSRFPFLTNFESRLALGAPWWKPDFPTGPARYARWMRYLVPQKQKDGSLDPLAIPPIADLMPPALRQKLGPDAPRFHAPSLDLTVHFLDPTPSEWLLINVWSRRARAGYATAEAEVWGEDGKLAAYATQTMILRRA